MVQYATNVTDNDINIDKKQYAIFTSGVQYTLMIAKAYSYIQFFECTFCKFNAYTLISEAMQKYMYTGR